MDEQQVRLVYKRTMDKSCAQKLVNGLLLSGFKCDVKAEQVEDELVRITVRCRSAAAWASVSEYIMATSC